MCVHNEKERSWFFGGHNSFDKQNKTEQKMFPTSKTEIILFRNLIFYHLLNVICLRLLFFDFFLGGGVFLFNFFFITLRAIHV